MSGDRSTEPRVRARAVADAPLDALLARSDELARRWVLSLIAARPLARIADVPLDELARTAPALCDALVRAIASDEQLERLAHGDGGIVEHAHDDGALVHDLDALRSILLDAALDELREPPARLVADLGDRIASVCAAALAAALARRGEAADAPSSARVPQFPYEPVVRATRSATTAGRARAVLVDELGVEPRPLGDDDGGGPTAARIDPHATRESPAARPTPRARPWDTPLAVPGEVPGVRVRRGASEPR